MHLWWDPSTRDTLDEKRRGVTTGSDHVWQLRKDTCDKARGLWGWRGLHVWGVKWSRDCKVLFHQPGRPCLPIFYQGITFNYTQRRNSLLCFASEIIYCFRSQKAKPLRRVSRWSSNVKQEDSQHPRSISNQTRTEKCQTSNIRTTPLQINWVHNGKRIEDAPPNPRRTVTSNSIMIVNLTKQVSSVTTYIALIARNQILNFVHLGHWQLWV